MNQYFPKVGAQLLPNGEGKFGLVFYKEGEKSLLKLNTRINLYRAYSSYVREKLDFDQQDQLVLIKNFQPINSRIYLKLTAAQAKLQYTFNHGSSVLTSNQYSYNTF